MATGLRNNEMESRQRQASALIMVVLTLALMVSVAVSFMNIVGRQKGTAVGVALQTHADIALQQAQAHTIRTFVDSIEETKNNNDIVVDYTTATNAAWRKEFDAVIDTDADFWTEDDRISTKPNGSTLDPSTTVTSAHPMINTRKNLFHMMGHSIGGWGHAIELGGGESLFTRWYNHAYLTTELKPVVIDPSLTEVEKVKLRKSARYVVRYTSQVYDVNGCFSVNNNFPETLQSGTSIARGGGSVDSLHYLRYQNYLRTYGRSFKSMLGCYYMFSNWGGTVQRRVQKRYDPTYSVADPLDAESVGFSENGKSTSQTAYGSLAGDPRLRMERGFRGGDLQFMQSSDVQTNAGNELFFGAGHKGRVYTWQHLSALRMGAADDTPPYWCTPYADSMQDSDLADPGGSVPVREVSTPWRVNMLSAPNYVLRGMISGLSSEARISHTRFTNANLFGKGYPEAFPLDFEAGKNVPLFRDDKGYSGGIMQGGNGDGIYANSYVLDVVTAITQSIDLARRAWKTEQEVLSKAYSDGSTFIDITATTNNGGLMLEQILREVYRILGEHKVNGGIGSLLSGDIVSVGLGNNAYDPLIDDKLMSAQLHAGDDTRAMEFVLNDYLISLFGKSNPSPASFRVGDAVSDDIAIDFNGDGKVESTVTGWHDYTVDKRTWSWWWDGLGPYVKVTDDNDYMKRPGWYRFVKDDLTGGRLTPYRKVGSDWVAISDVDAFYAYNDLWLNEGADYPIKPFAKTGRMFIGKSRVLYGFIRAEVYDIIGEKVSSAANRNFAYRVDPDEDGDYSDNVLLIQSELKLVN